MAADARRCSSSEGAVGRGSSRRPETAGFAEEGRSSSTLPLLVHTERSRRLRADGSFMGERHSLAACTGAVSGGPSSPRIGGANYGLPLKHVVLLERDPAGPKLGDRVVDVLDRP